MVLVHLIQPSLIASAKDDAEYVGGKKLAEWEIFIVNYLQLYKRPTPTLPVREGDWAAHYEL
jgi:hypothetical protein